MKATRFEIMGDDGEWQPLEGVTAVELHAEPTPPLAEQIARAEAERARKAQEAINAFARAYAEAMRPAMESAAAALAEFGRIVRRAGVIDEQGQPVKRPDRPPWQSPYGPPRRR